MSPGQRESGPLAGAASQDSASAPKSKHIVSRRLPAVVDGAHAIVLFDAAHSRAEDIARRLLTSSKAEREAYCEGRTDGYFEGETAGFARGYAACDDEISSLQRKASRVVTAMVRLPERGPGTRAVAS